jgi:hypothetical protein
MKGGDDQMSSYHPHDLFLVNRWIAERMHEASAERFTAENQRVDQARPGIRRSIGHSMIKLGERLAAEPPLQSARSR